MKRAMRKHFRDFMAIVFLVVRGRRRRRLHPVQPALLPAGVGAGGRHRLLRGRGRVPDRPGRRAGPGPDGEHRRRQGRRHRQRAARGRARGGGDEDPARSTRRCTATRRSCCGPRPGSRTCTWSSTRAPSRRRARGGRPIPVSNTLPDVNPDEMLAPARRRHARLPADPARAPAPRRSTATRPASCAQTFKRFEPTTRDAREITQLLSRAAGTSRGSIHNFQELATELGSKDRELAGLVDSSNANFEAIARQDESLREALRLLPGHARPDDDHAGEVDDAGGEPRPGAAEAAPRRPRARAVAARRARPFLRETTPVIKDQLRPFARDVRPPCATCAGRRSRPRRRHPAAGQDLKVRQRGAQQAGLQPARQRGGLPVLELVGGPQRRHGVRHPGRPRARAPRPARPLAATRSASLDQIKRDDAFAEGPDRSSSTRRAESAVCPRPRVPLGDGQGNPQPRQDPRDGRRSRISCVGILLYLWLTFGGSVPLRAEGYRFEVKFPEATQLAQEADVRISGVNVGKVKTKKPDDETGLTDATIEIDSKYAPIPRDTRAILRQKTLLGETYVELTPGDRDGAEAAPTAASSRWPRWRRRSSSTRSSAPSTRRPARRSPTTSTSRAGPSATGGQQLNDALGSLTPFAENVGRRAADPRPPGRRHARRSCATPAWSSTRSPSARASCARWSGTPTGCSRRPPRATASWPRPSSPCRRSCARRARPRRG